MIELESRLRSLADSPLPPPTASPDALRTIAARRRRAHRKVAGIAAIAVPLVLALVAAAAWTLTDDQPQQVSVGPSTSSSSPSELPSAPGSRTLGGLTGVTVSVTPRTDLLDGQQIDVSIDGLDRVPGATIVICAGDVTESTASASCDFQSVTDADTDGGGPGLIVAAAQQTVSVRRMIRISRGSDPNVAAPYDCALEPAGCVLAVGPTAIPVRAALVPITFAPVAVPTPSATLEQSTGLRAGQEVVLRAEGLTPNESFRVTECLVGRAGECDVIDTTWTTADADGKVATPARVWAAIYRYDGRVDCTVEACSVALADTEGSVVVEVPFSFAEGVVAPTPRLQVEPDGPYQDRQTVTVTGTGFRPGLNLLGQLGQCPADKDTAIEERCGYDIYTTGGAVVAADGTFTATARLYESLVFTGTCRGTPGCVLGWVIPHGTTLAKVPLSFVPLTRQVAGPFRPSDHAGDVGLAPRTPGWSIDRFGPGVTPSAPPGHVLVHAPHAGTSVPDDLRRDLLLDDAALEAEIGAMTDWHTDRLALVAFERAGVSGTIFRNRLSRLVIDPERFPDDREVMLSRGMGAVYTRTSTLEALRRTPAPADQPPRPAPAPAPAPRGFEDLLSAYFEPYAATLSETVQEILVVRGRCVLVDLHSYPSAPLPYELDQTAHRPGVCIGTDPFHTPDDLREAVATAFSGVTDGVDVDTPFAGTYVPLAHHRSDRRLTSVMVEIRRDLYLDEPSTIAPAGFDDVADRLASLLGALAARTG